MSTEHLSRLSSSFSVTATTGASAFSSQVHQVLLQLRETEHPQAGLRGKVANGICPSTGSGMARGCLASGLAEQLSLETRFLSPERGAWSVQLSGPDRGLGGFPQD